MPSNQTPLGALPARFRRQRLLIVGCGDVGQRVARLAPAPLRVMALTSSPENCAVLRGQGILPLRGNLDDAKSLRRLAGLATRMVHLAPPPTEGWSDPRTLALLRSLDRRAWPRSWVSGSTSGVYGDCHGAWVHESQPVTPFTPRAYRRVDAEKRLRWHGKGTGVRQGVRASILRIPGIYALDRDGGTPQERLRKGTPVLQASDDVYTNHIHADDLARACWLALWRGQPQRVYHVSDDSQLKMGDYFDVAADIFGLPRPPRVPRDNAHNQLPLMLLSFMSESRRLENTRMKQELGLRLRYPTVHTGLQAGEPV